MPLRALQAQGQVQLEARCAGVQAGLGSEGTMTKLYVNGIDDAAMQSSMNAKLTQDKSIDAVITLGARSRWSRSTRSSRRTAAPSSTPSTNAALIAKIRSGRCSGPWTRA